MAKVTRKKTSKKPRGPGINHTHKAMNASLKRIQVLADSLLVMMEHELENTQKPASDIQTVFDAKAAIVQLNGLMQLLVKLHEQLLLSSDRLATDTANAADMSAEEMVLLKAWIQEQN